MNILTLKFFDDSIICYEYQPEGKGGRGVITHNKKNNTTEITQTAANDDNSYYARMAKSKVATLVTNKSLPLECVQAWY